MRECNFIIAVIYVAVAIAHTIFAIKYRSKQPLIFATIYAIAALTFFTSASTIYT